MTTPTEDSRVATARDILSEPRGEATDLGAAMHRIGQLEAAVDMLLRVVDERGGGHE